MTKAITTARLNVRKGAGTSYSVVKTLPEGTIIDIDYKKKIGNTTWYRSDTNQWVSGEYLTLMDKDNNEITVTPSISMSQLQSYLKESGCTIRFSPGTYNITKMLHIYSNTNIILGNAILIRKFGGYVFMTYADQSTTKYNGQHDISITGGKIIGNGSKKVSNIISLAHAKNITIQGLTIEKSVGSHSIEINACSDVAIERCHFNGNIIDKKNPYREAIQIDASYYGGLNYASSKSARCYDGTCCRNIKIIDCKFKGFTTCIGTHTQMNNDKKHTNIKILNNNCIGVGAINGYGSCLRIINFDDVLIEGNDMSNFARGVEIISSNRFYSTNGSITKIKPSYITGSKDIVIRNNYLHHPSKDYQASGIFISSKFNDLIHDNILVENNNFVLNNGKSKYEVFYDFATNVVVRDNKSDV